MTPATDPIRHDDLARRAERSLGAPGPRSPQEIELELARTRERIGRDLDVLGEKLSPEHLRQLGVEAARNARDRAVGQLQEKVRGASDELRDLGTRGLDAVERHPIPAALLALGVSLIGVGVAARASESSHDPDTVSVHLTAEQRASIEAERRRNRRRFDPVGSVVRHPVATGIVTLLAGAALGALLPARHPDDESQPVAPTSPLDRHAVAPDVATPTASPGIPPLRPPIGTAR